MRQRRFWLLVGLMWTALAAIGGWVAGDLQENYHLCPAQGRYHYLELC